MIKAIKKAFVKFWYRSFLAKATNPPPVDILFKNGFSQRVLRKNRAVIWPVHPSTVIKGWENIDPGTRSPGLSPRCYLDGRNGIRFGHNVWMGPDVKVISQNHDVTDYTKYLKDDPIIIGNNVWIGAGSIILPGVRIADHVVIAAGSVVSKSVTTSDVVIGGVPARVIKHISPYVDGSTPA